jgi:hypothetical protein
MPKVPAHTWAFKPRFRRRAFGWRSQPAILRIREAVSEISRMTRTDPALAADGAVQFLERVSPALENIDSSSGAIGTAVNNAIEMLAPIIAAAPVDRALRERWLERLWEAHQNDGMSYIESLGDLWGDLCAAPDVASVWADRLLPALRIAWGGPKDRRGHLHGTSVALSALFKAERYNELLDVLELGGGGVAIWSYCRWGVKALAALGRKAEALRYAERSRTSGYALGPIARVCEEILLTSGFADEAYARYAIEANTASTYLATFRSIVKKYPHKEKRRVLADLVATTPGSEGKWFAAAKSAGMREEAIRLATLSPTDPKTLARAAKDFAETDPPFALEASINALRWIVAGYGFEITSVDVLGVYRSGQLAAERLGNQESFETRVRALTNGDTSNAAFLCRSIAHKPR